MSRRKVWVSSPNAGGSAIPPRLQEETRRRILAHAEAQYAGKYNRIEVRFRGAFCYIDAYCEPAAPTRGLLRTLGETKEEYYERRRAVRTHLCRLRYFALRGWTLAFYTYSHERYEPTFFPSGALHGTPEEALDVGAVYLQ